ncbi:MAG: hypothetical protein ACLFPX_02690 [Candidatus Omnitrophota bacterium]
MNEKNNTEDRQPIDGIMETSGLRNHDLVDASAEQITHKMVAKARKGRRLSRKVQEKICRALNARLSAGHTIQDLFTYQGK